jgi:polyisoprenoid-binding protein YceI
MAFIETAELIPTGTWTADPSHSHVEFAVKHMKIATVKGRAGAFSARLDASGPEPRLEGVVEAASITTHDSERDGHLASPEFFDSERYPEIRFQSTRFEEVGERALSILGDITIKGVTKEIELTGSFTGAGLDPWGNERTGIDVTGVIDRHDFGLDWNAPLPGGGLLVADDVTVSASFSFIREA